MLRYNQRGVGSSSGSKLGGRRHDAADLAALVDFVLGQLRGTNKRVAVVGWVPPSRRQGERCVRSACFVRERCLFCGAHRVVCCQVWAVGT